MQKKIKNYVIAGGGTAGWMAAALLSKTMGNEISITLVESEMIGTVGVGEATIPPILRYNNILGVNEAEFMRETMATFKLGIEFEHWKDVGHKYLHSFGHAGKDHWTAGFQHFWLAGKKRTRTASPSFLITVLITPIIWMRAVTLLFCVDLLRSMALCAGKVRLAMSA